MGRVNGKKEGNVSILSSFIKLLIQLALKEIKLHSPAEITKLSDFPKMVKLVSWFVANAPGHTTDHRWSQVIPVSKTVYVLLSQTPNGLLLTPSPLLSSIHFWSSLSPVAPLSPARLQGPNTLFQVSIWKRTFKCGISKGCVSPVNPAR